MAAKKAPGVELATAYVAIVPSLQGLEKTVRREFGGITEQAKKTGEKAGESLEKGIESKVSGSGRSSWSKRLFGKAEKDSKAAGKKIGDNLQDGIEKETRDTSWSKRMFSRVQKDGASAGKKTGGRFKTGMSSALKGFGAGLFVGVGADQLVGLFKDATKNASDLEQSVGGVQAVFKEFAPQIQKASEGASQALGLTKNEYNELAAVLGAGLKNKGIKDFAQQTQGLIGIGADLSAQYGGTTKEAVGALASAMRGEMDPIERYGVTMNAAMLEAEAYAAGIVKRTKDTDGIKKAQNDAIVAQRKYNEAVKKSGKNSDEALVAESRMLAANSRLQKVMEGKKTQLTDQQKAQAALSLITKQTADAQGAFGREADTLAGKQQRLSATWTNLKTTLGQYLLPVISEVAGKLNDFFVDMEKGEGAGGKFKQALKDTGATLSDLWTKIQPVANWIKDNPKYVGLAVAAYLGFRTVSKVISAAKAAHAAYNAVVNAGKVVGAAWKATTYSMAAAQKFYTATVNGGTGAVKAKTAAEKIGMVVGKAQVVVTKAMAGAQRLLNAAFKANPIGFIITALIALGAGLVLLYKKSETFRRIVDAAWAGIKKAAAATVAWFKNTAWPWMRDVFTKIGSVVRWLWDNIYKPYFTKIWGIAKSVFGWIKNTGWPILKVALAAIGNAAMWLWTNAIKPAFGFIWGIAKSVFGWIANTGWPLLKTAFNAIGSVVSWLWTNIYQPYFTKIWGIAKSVFGWIKSTGWPLVKSALSAIGSAAATLWSKWIKPNFDRMKSGAQALVGAFRSARDGIGKAFSALKDKIAGPIKTVLSWIDKNFISKVKSMLHSVNLGDLSKKIPYLTPGGKGYARGGWTGPGSTYTPAGVVHADEFVVKKSSRRRFEQENPGLLDHVNRTGTLAGYAMGGKVGGLNTAFRRALDRFNEAAGGRFSVLSGLRTRAEQAVLYQRYLNGTGNLAARPGTSRHESGNAADLVPSTARDTHGALARRFGLHFPVPGEPWHVELINGGKGGGGNFFTGLLGKVMDKGASVVRGLLDKFSGDGSLFQRFAIGAMKMSVDGITKLIQRGGNEMLAGDGGLDSKFQSLATGTNVNIGRSMAASRGWTGNQWLALKELWTRESNWRHTALNPSSGAYGIPQALPASKMASAGGDWRINPATQIAWGLGYIKQRYGTPAAALAWHNSHNWYAGGGLVKRRPLEFDNGGYLPTGVTTVVNNTGKPEPLGRLDTMGFAEDGIIRATFVDADGILMGTIDGRIDQTQAHAARVGRNSGL